MKVLLVYPPITQNNRGGRSTPSPIPPLGLLYVASFLEREGHTVQILDCVAEFGQNIDPKIGTTKEEIETEIKRRVIEYNPDIVGVGAMFTSYAKDAHRFAALVKSILPNVPIIFGGPHSSVFFDRVLQDKNVDVVVIGEGEETTAELLTAYSTKQSINEIKGIAIRVNSKIKKNEPREFIKDIDKLPLPARHLIDLKRYTTRHRNPYVMRDSHTFVSSSRGCPFNCIYCSIHAIWKHTWRPRSVKGIVDEIEYLAKTYDIGEIHFVDDNVSANKKRMEELVDELIRRKLDIKWTCPNGIAIWTLDENLLKKMKQSGCYRLTFGIESGCQETQKFVRKNLDLEKAERLIKYANDIGIWTVGTFIIGFPYETKEQMDQSLDFAIRTKLDFPIFYILMPFPRTDIWNILLEESLLDVNDFFKETDYYLSNRGCDSKYFTHKELQMIIGQMYRKAMSSVLSRTVSDPVHYIKKIKTLEDLGYSLKLISNFSNMLIKNRLEKKNAVGGRVLSRPGDPT